MANTLQRLRVRNWKQFGEVDLDLSKQVTILTGANGTGKTTLLGVLSLALRNFPTAIAFLSTPVVRKSEDDPGYRAPIRLVDQVAGDGAERLRVGELAISGGEIVPIIVRDEGDIYHWIEFDETAPGSQFSRLPGVAFSSDRASFAPLRLKSVSNSSKDWWNNRDDTEPVGELLRASWEGVRNTPPFNQPMKEAIIAWSLFGEGNSKIDAEPVLVQHLNDFEEIARSILPESLGFVGFVSRRLDVVVKTAHGELPLDSLSGGFAALLEYAWAIHFYSTNRYEPMVVLIDEAENHLHAELQRQLLPKLSSAFPHAKFIVSTHSPLIASSIRDCAVYALHFNDENVVESFSLDLDARAGSASDVLRDVLGLEATIPIWAEQRLKEIADQFSTAPVTRETRAELRNALRSDGLEEFAARMIGEMIVRSERDLADEVGNDLDS